MLSINMATPSSKLENCEVCGTNKAKYTCPKCEVRTCCMACIKIHKKELDCDGIRKKTNFVPLKSFTDLDLLSDYRLLEEVGRSIDKLKRNPAKKYTRQIALPVYLNKLRQGAYQRKIYLHFMPQNFSRHKKNTTFLNWKTNELSWRIEWIFPQADNLISITERALETTRLAELLEQVLYPMSSSKNNDDFEEINVKLNLNEKLQFYQAAGTTGLKILLKAEKIIKSDYKFHELDFALTLRENLENKAIIEFPTLYVVFKDRGDTYEIIDTDEEVLDNSCSKINSKQRQKRFKRKLNDNDNEPVNYFFNTEYSESDDERLHKDSYNVHNETKKHFSIPFYDELVKIED